METDEFGIPIIHRDTAEEFLAQVDELHPRWNRGRWIFRGQNDIDWTLLAPTMRESFFRDYVVEYVIGSDEGAKMQMEFGEVLVRDVLKDHPCFRLTAHAYVESHLVQTFISLSDRASLPIPYERVDTAEMFEDLMKVVQDWQKNDYDPARLSIRISPNSINYALAQHHRIPTRLLDFTYRPLVAAFFASAVEKNLDKKPARSVVFAIDINQLEHTSLRLVRHRMSQIGFLQAQEGLFVYDSLADVKWMNGDNVNWMPFETELQKLVLTNGVYKIAMPFDERERLLIMLRRKRVAKPFLMPSFDNVSEAIRDNPRLWKEYVE